MLLSAARTALQDLDEEKPDWSYGSLVALTFSALAVEALANAFGDRMVERWDDFERAPPIAKLRIVCAQLCVEMDFGKAPWGTIKWLLKFRNDIAHAKPVLLKTEHQLTAQEYEARRFERPISGLEKKITVHTARQAYAAVDQLKELWIAKVPSDKLDGLYADSWSGSASLARQEPR